MQWWLQVCNESIFVRTEAIATAESDLLHFPFKNIQRKSGKTLKISIPLFGSLALYNYVPISILKTVQFVG